MLKVKIASNLWIVQYQPNQYTVGDLGRHKGPKSVKVGSPHYFPTLELAARYCRDRLALSDQEIDTVEQMVIVYSDATDRIIKALRGGKQ